MSPGLLKLAALLLEQQGERLGSRGNEAELTLPAELSDEDVAALALLANRHNFKDCDGGFEALREAQGIHPDDLVTPEKLRRRSGTTDARIMRALAFGLREELSK